VPPLTVGTGGGSPSRIRESAAVVEVIVLGSGTPNPDPKRAGPSVAVADGSSWVLVDCGRAATQRALGAGLDLTALRGATTGSGPAAPAVHRVIANVARSLRWSE
jgi:ribonuclease BN (tRNA processing enzyme)